VKSGKIGTAFALDSASSIRTTRYKTPSLRSTGSAQKAAQAGYPHVIHDRFLEFSSHLIWNCDRPLLAELALSDLKEQNRSKRVRHPSPMSDGFSLRKSACCPQKEPNYPAYPRRFKPSKPNIPVLNSQAALGSGTVDICPGLTAHAYNKESFSQGFWRP